jgi:type IV fimbrial biogenesis protein FimT
MQRSAGLSLVELLAALAMLLLTLLAGVPAFAELRERSQRAAVNNELVATLGLARNEALLSRQPTVVCPAIADGRRCRMDGEWHHGWLAFVDADDDGQPGGKDDRLLVRTEAIPDLTLISGTGRPRVRFAPNGMSTGSNLSIRLCQRDLPRSAVIVNNVGRPRVEVRAKALQAWSCPAG